MQCRRRERWRRVPCNSDYASHGLFVNSNTPDFDGLANAQIPIHHDRRAVMTNVNRLAFAQEVFAAFGGGDTKVQIQKNSFAAAEVLVQA
jgi:hypothetical protein